MLFDARPSHGVEKTWLPEYAYGHAHTIDTEQEVDGRWLSEARELPGVMGYGATRAQSQAKTEALALRVLAERLETSEIGPLDLRVQFDVA